MIMQNKKVFIITIIILVIDIITKIIISNLMNLNESIKIIKNFLYLTYAKNDGIAFSYLEGNRLFIILASIIIIGFILSYLYKNKTSKIETISFGLILGGAIGNLLDRIIYGYVIDFIDIYIFNYNYPIFNIADIGVVIGVFLLIINGFIKK